MLSKNKARLVISLRNKKAREQEGLYVIEGDKLVREFLLEGALFRMLIAKPDFVESLPGRLKQNAGEIITVTDAELKSVSLQKTPQNALALVLMPDKPMDTGEILNGLSVALSTVQDPGNLGTIIRAAAWFGIRDIVCSADCADVYNPKVIQATMGAILHTSVYYTGLRDLLIAAAERKLPVYGTLLGGRDIYRHTLSSKGIILLGNESKGIREELLPFITDSITIPGARVSGPGIDSLNVGMAASIVFSEFFRRSQEGKNK